MINAEKIAEERKEEGKEEGKLEMAVVMIKSSMSHGASFEEAINEVVQTGLLSESSIQYLREKFS